MSHTASFPVLSQLKQGIFGLAKMSRSTRRFWEGRILSPSASSYDSIQFDQDHWPKSNDRPTKKKGQLSARLDSLFAVVMIQLNCVTDQNGFCLKPRSRLVEESTFICRNFPANRLTLPAEFAILFLS